MALFAEFAKSDKAQWKQQAIKDLKGKDFDQTLTWHTQQGFNIAPFYNDEDLESLTVTTLFQGVKQNFWPTVADWQNREAITVSDEKTANQQAVHALKAGADAICFDLSHQVVANFNMAKLLDKIKLSENAIFFKINHQSVALIGDIKKVVGYYPKGGLVDDCLAEWVSTGAWHEDCWTQKALAIRQTSDWQQFKALTISSHVFHNAGANAAQELAFLLASAITYLDKLTDEGLSVDEIVNNIEFSVSVGTDYFIEIAKLRALRYLFRRVVESFSPMETAHTYFIHATTSTFYDAAITPYTNLLRATTEAMSAVLGGCNALSIHAYDHVYHPETEFSQRIARNISTILKEESYLNQTVDPAAGSYYLETLTVQLAEQAWHLLQEVEAQGGFVEAIKNNWIQNQIKVVWENQSAALQANKAVMVGVNKFRFDEEPFEKLRVSEPISFEIPSFILLENRRLSSTFEA
ncbi:MAG: methylmalonyl-CoA mutase subunit beta [Spirosomataceae bacterium]